MTFNGLDSLNPPTLLLLVPLVVVQFGLLILAVVDLLRDDRRVRGGNKGVWAVIIVFVSLLGPILYFLVGREEGPVEPQAPGPGAMPGWGSPHDPPLTTQKPGAPAGAPAEGIEPLVDPLAVRPLPPSPRSSSIPPRPPPSRSTASASGIRAASSRSTA